MVNVNWFVEREGQRICRLRDAEWLDALVPFVQRMALARSTSREIYTWNSAMRLLAQERAESQRLEQGSGRDNWADSLVGVVRGVGAARREWDHVAGWGGNR